MPGREVWKRRGRAGVRSRKPSPRRILAPPAPGVESLFHWRYPSLDAALAQQKLTPAELQAALAEKDSVVATNAAIALARRGEGAGQAQLAAGVGRKDLPLSMRLAAAEAMGGLPQGSAVAPLRKLIDQHGDCSPVPGPRYVAELHAELIRALARHLDPAEDPRFVRALESPDPQVKVAVLHAWAGGRVGTLPAAAAALTKAADGRVRTAAIHAVAMRRPPQAAKHLAAALDDQDVQVRAVAAKALGDLGGAEATSILERLLEDRAEVVRMAAVAGLAAQGAQQSVLKCVWTNRGACVLWLRNR